MDKKIRRYICEVLMNNEDLLRIQLRQRAEIEGWLKFEFASYLESTKYEDVEV